MPKEYETTLNNIAIKIALSDDKKTVQLLSPKKTKPIAIVEENIKNFVTNFTKGIAKVSNITASEEDISKTSESVLKFLTEKEEDISLEFEEETTKPEQETPAKEKTALTLEFQTTKTNEKEKPKKEEKSGKPLDMSEVVVFYQNCITVKKMSHKDAHAETAKHFGIPEEVLNKFIPLTEEDIKPIKQPETTKTAQTLLTGSETQTSQPQPNVPQQSLDKALNLSQVPGYEFLKDEQLGWINVLSENVYHVEPAVLIQRYIKEAEKYPVKSPTLWLTLLFKDAQAHSVLKLKKEFVRQEIFAIADGEGFTILPTVSETNMKDDEGKIITLVIDRCYNLPELQKSGRLIAMTNAPFLRDKEEYGKTPLIKKIVAIGELPAIPKAHQIIEPLTLTELTKKARESPNKEIQDAFLASLVGINNWNSGKGCFIVVYDGSDVGKLSNKVSMSFQDNPFGIDEETLKNSIEKLVLGYGNIIYQPKQEKFSEGLTIQPMYFRIVS